MNPDDLKIITSRLIALGYQLEKQATQDGFLLLQKVEPFKRKLMIIGTSFHTPQDWRHFIIHSVLLLRNTPSPVVVGILIDTVAGCLVEEKTLEYIAEMPWVEAIWEKSNDQLFLRKSHFRWEVEDKVMSLTARLASSMDEAEKPTEEEEANPSRFPRPTYLFLLLNLAVFLLEIILGGSKNTEVLIRLGAKYNPRLWMGEYWRLLTPLFLHAGWEHFLFNSLALLQLGTIVEKFFGKLKFCWIYLISGIFGSLAGAIFRPDVISVGASGAIFGLLGALVYFSIRKPLTARKIFGRSLWLMLGVNLCLGFIIPGIDYFGHLGGLIGGLLSAYAVGLVQKDFIPDRWVWMVVLLSVLSISIKTALTPPANNWHLSFDAGRSALARGDIEEAQMKLEESLVLNPRSGMAKKMLASLYLEQGYHALNREDLDEAVLFLEKSRSLDQSNRVAERQLLRAYLYRGFARYNAGDLSGTEEDCLKGLALDDEIEGFHYILGAVYYRQNKIPEAIREMERVLMLNPKNKNAQVILEELRGVQSGGED
ncbi:MAG: rhomboid family intramembrane serine protease [Firmicutes bacterium]|nr:rhomboid family intramembrane serine protease [Bacillota bacterium]